MTGKQKYMTTYNGRKLLELYSLDKDGIWEVYGEDPNCDLGGTHHQPKLGTFKGKLNDVIDVAVDLPGFWQWGAGGNFKLAEPIVVVDVNTAMLRKKKLAELAHLEAQVQKLRTELKI